MEYLPRINAEIATIKWKCSNISCQEINNSDYKGFDETGKKEIICDCCGSKFYVLAPDFYNF
jgi:hypothetical protein